MNSVNVRDFFKRTKLITDLTAKLLNTVTEKHLFNNIKHNGITLLNFVMLCMNTDLIVPTTSNLQFL